MCARGPNREENREGRSALFVDAFADPTTTNRPSADRTMIVSGTVLGARGKSQQAIADDVVGYLEKGRTKAPAGRRPGSVIELPSPAGGTVAYYADSTGLRPGRWLLGREGTVESEVLAKVLAGEDPVTGARLLSGSGHAERAAHGQLAGVVADPN